MDWKALGLTALTAFGAALLWARWSYSPKDVVQMKAMGFDALVRHLPLRRAWKEFVGFVIFITVGGIVGMVIVSPVDGRQAIAAGFGWTALLGQPSTVKPKPKGRAK